MCKTLDMLQSFVYFSCCAAGYQQFLQESGLITGVPCSSLSMVITHFPIKSAGGCKEKCMHEPDRGLQCGGRCKAEHPMFPEEDVIINLWLDSWAACLAMGKCLGLNWLETQTSGRCSLFLPFEIFYHLRSNHNSANVAANS